MNIFLISTFTLSLAAGAYMLWKKVSLIRKAAGEEQVEDQEMHNEFFEKFLKTRVHENFSDINEIKNIVYNRSLEYGHKSVLLLLKMWIKSLYFAKKQNAKMKEEVKKITAKLPKLPYHPSTEKGIWHKLTHYKSRLERTVQMMKEQEERNMK